MSKNYTLQQSPNTTGYPSPEFDKGAFDAAITQKGYRIYQERAVACPCGMDAGHPNPSCPYCGGTGYYYIDPTEVICLITGVNVNTKYREWTMDNAGTIAVSTYDEGLNFSFFDKLTFKEKFGIFSENRVVRAFNAMLFVWLTFQPFKLFQLSVIDGNGQLQNLTPDSYYTDPENNEYTLFFNANAGLKEGDIVSVYYKHYVQYNVIDLPHEIRASNKTDENGNLQKIDLPVQAIARRANFVVNESNQTIKGGEL